MGCDIHATMVARRESDNFYMVVADDVLRNRNYFLFALMANVRNGWGVEPVAKQKGFPKWFNGGATDTNDEYESRRYRCFGGDHSYSWLSLDELRNVADRYEKEAPDDWAPMGVGRESIAKAIRSLCDYAESVEPEYQHYLIFSFDS